MIGAEDQVQYKELPFSWTIGREGSLIGSDVFYGLNKYTGEETERFPTYGGALREVERRELEKFHVKKN